MTKGDAADQLVAKAIDSFGKIDIIVNNAGYTIDAPIHKMSDEQFQAMLDIHLIVPFKVIRAAAPHLREPAKKEREEGQGGLPQDRQRLFDLGHDGATRARPTTHRPRQASPA